MTATDTPVEETSAQSPSEQPTQGASAQPDGTDEWNVTDRWQTDRSWFGGIALLALLVTFWLLGGVMGIAVWLVIAGTWFVLPVIIPFALGSLGLVALAPEATLIETAPAQVSLFGLLCASIVARDRSVGDIVWFSAVAAVIVAILLWMRQTTNLVFAGALAVGSLCLVSYILHRYLLVTLGLVDDVGPPE